ncbi:hypothetical protein, partial [Klebsiella michiganensis]|uniref:hypothetical protein n=1 Tax=Klebsiella michiganensis TaxID=1134687 RepID=UPI003B988128
MKVLHIAETVKGGVGTIINSLLIVLILFNANRNSEAIDLPFLEKLTTIPFIILLSSFGAITRLSTPSIFNKEFIIV